MSQRLPMNGNMYWIATNTKTEIFIQSFDISTETFKPICCNVPIANELFNGPFHVQVVLSGFKGDRLSLLNQLHRHDGGIEVWVTNKVTDEVVSWSKYFNVTRPGLPELEFRYHHRTLLTYFIHNKTNNIMLCCEEDDAKERYVNIYEIGEVKLAVKDSIQHRNSFNDMLAPSLVPVHVITFDDSHWYFKSCMFFSTASLYFLVWCALVRKHHLNANAVPTVSLSSE
ncbi:unnamed protein product [Thlaspi arvense]|uniref:F-box associated beta-propeller type 1 domain-containing protein n=1 Tax=Thlaspi arvense TaxID=13288 RepID=A0AAU9SEW4_THLAR|nr:unnamed protein product [Thlaspi arvense]